MGKDKISELYITTLSSLSAESKIILATMLLDSVTNLNKDKGKLTMDTRFSGNWGDGLSANMVADELRKKRSFSRTVESW